MNVRRMPLLGLALAMASLGACGSTRSASFYLLDGLPATERVAEAPEVAIAVGPVSLPEYLDRPQLVRRGGGQEVVLSEFDRWAEPLQSSLQRVLITNLATLLGTERVRRHTQRGVEGNAYRVAVEIDRFEGIADGSVALDARWRIVDEQQERALVVRRTSILYPGVGTGAAARVAAMDEAFADLSREIAGGLAGVLEAP